MAFVNTLDARLPGLAASVATRLTYPGPADTYPTTLLAADPAVRLRQTDGTSVRVPITGGYNFPNLAAAAAVGQHFGISPAEVAAALAGYAPPNNRSQVQRTAAGDDVVLDAYNANPNSVAAALRSFAHRPCAPGQTKLVVLGDMLELRAASSYEHRAVGELLAGLPLPQALLIGPEMAAAAAAFPQAQHVGTKAEAVDWLRRHSVRGQQVLVKGSRGLALETLVEQL